MNKLYYLLGVVVFIGGVIGLYKYTDGATCFIATAMLCLIMITYVDNVKLS